MIFFKWENISRSSLFTNQRLPVLLHKQPSISNTRSILLPRRPVISGADAIKAFSKIGFHPISQTGSHVHLYKESTKHGPLTITVPLHQTLAVGTLNVIVSEIARYEEIPKQQIFHLLR
ncbi:type II toxin-antitoxin system HicA family toxin [Methanoculleus sp.]|uniref:type II toxin-antitoxin system HicA family toxin n=1 Tax=Methanoculleus sp. TaxID=90427 RepID=UPI003FA544FC